MKHITYRQIHKGWWLHIKFMVMELANCLLLKRTACGLCFVYKIKWLSDIVFLYGIHSKYLCVYAYVDMCLFIYMFIYTFFSYVLFTSLAVGRNEYWPLFRSISVIYSKNISTETTWACLKEDLTFLRWHSRFFATLDEFAKWGFVVM